MLKRLTWNAYLARQMIGQRKIPFRPLEELEAMQSRRVRAMVRHAYATVPFYRDEMRRLGLTPAEFRDVDDLRQLPIVEKEQLQREGHRFRSTAYRRADSLRLRTGGSTGIACTVDIDTAALFQNAAHGERERDLITPLLGDSFGYRETVIGSPTTTDRVVQEHCQRKGWFPSGLRMKRQYLSLVDSPDENLRRLNGFQPRLLRSYGSYLEELFLHLQRSGSDFVRPKVITYSSDALSPGIRRLIRDGFGIPVFGFYEAVEAFKIGFECDRAAGVHQNADLFPLRLVDEEGHPVPDGASGEVVVSNLVNRATVLLNYRLGDFASWVGEPCGCGRTLPLLSLPEGRSDEFLTLPDGRRIHPQSVRTIVLEDDGVWQFQAVQESLRELRLTVVPDPEVDGVALRNRLSHELALVLGDAISIHVELVEHIPRRASASKFRVVVSKLGSNGGDAENGTVGAGAEEAVADA